MLLEQSEQERAVGLNPENTKFAREPWYLAFPFFLIVCRLEMFYLVPVAIQASSCKLHYRAVVVDDERELMSICLSASAGTVCQSYLYNIPSERFYPEESRRGRVVRY